MSRRPGTYGYDGFGNLTSTTSWVNGSGTTRTNAVVGSTNRLSAAGYDAAGNQTTWGTYAYTWDLMGSMKAYQGSGNDWAYAYDVDDERMLVYNVVTGQSTFRIRGLDGKVLREVKLAGGVWSWGKDWIYRNGQLLATAAPGSVVRYAHADHLGSPRLLTDASGVVKERYHYYPFGEQAGTAPTAPEALRFTGHERDSGASSGTADDLDYMHARYYHPQLGRFLSFDPVGGNTRTPASWNRYAYVLNNPLRFIDPLGLVAATFGEQITVCGNCSVGFTRDFWEMARIHAQQQAAYDPTFSERLLVHVNTTVAQTFGEVVVGFGDTLSFGITDWIRTEQGLADMVDTDSNAYMIGQVTGTVHGIVLGGALAVKATASTTLFGPGSWANTGRYIRIGHSGHKGKTFFSIRGEAVDRIKGQVRSHIDLWRVK